MRRMGLTSVAVWAVTLCVGPLTAGVPELYDYSAPGSHLSTLELELIGSIEESAAFDLNGDGSPNNAIRVILDTLGPPLEINVNAIVLEAIQDGSIAIGASWPIRR